MAAWSVRTCHRNARMLRRPCAVRVPTSECSPASVQLLAATAHCGVRARASAALFALLAFFFGIACAHARVLMCSRSGEAEPLRTATMLCMHECRGEGEAQRGGDQVGQAILRTPAIVCAVREQNRRAAHAEQRVLQHEALVLARVPAILSHRRGCGPAVPTSAASSAGQARVGNAKWRPCGVSHHIRLGLDIHEIPRGRALLYIASGPCYI